jgi:hypothetical protein
MTTLRRFLALAALLYWQGGFLFYAAVVIPIGLVVLKDEKYRQTSMTDEVAFRCQVGGAVALAILLWEWSAAVDPTHRRLRGLAWAVLSLTLAALFVLHARLHQLRPANAEAVVADPAAFRLIHGLYIGVGAAQVLAAAAYLWLSLTAWRAADARHAPKPAIPSPPAPAPRRSAFGPGPDSDS